MNTEADIVAALQARLQLQGWPLRTIGRLAPCHAHDQPVTPYFHVGSCIQRPWNAWNVDGSVGVIHREFEAHWARRYPNHPSTATFPTWILFVNFRELRELRSIPSSGPFLTEIDALAKGVVQFLNTLPATEDELRAAVRQDRLGPHPLRKFAHPFETGKFNAFVDYMKADPPHRQG